jgi:sec-independent protein translocase protein TatA
VGGIKIWHIVVLIIAFVILFGWKNLPSVARSLGESMRVFKTEVDQMKDDNAARKDRAPGEPPLTGTTTGATGATTGATTSAATDAVEEPYRDTAREEYRRLEERTDDGDPRA